MADCLFVSARSVKQIDDSWRSKMQHIKNRSRLTDAKRLLLWKRGVNKKKLLVYVCCLQLPPCLLRWLTRTVLIAARTTSQGTRRSASQAITKLTRPKEVTTSSRARHQCTRRGLSGLPTARWHSFDPSIRVVQYDPSTHHIQHGLSYRIVLILFPFSLSLCAFNTFGV
jgi:hypothetical protein